MGRAPLFRIHTIWNNIPEHAAEGVLLTIIQMFSIACHSLLLLGPIV
jgi:hypothetical protein